MVKHDHVILGVHVTDRIKRALDVQKLFSKYGQHVRTRLGLHQVCDDRCVPGGIILLEMMGDRKRCDKLAEKLAALEGVEVKKWSSRTNMREETSREQECRVGISLLMPTNSLTSNLPR